MPHKTLAYYVAHLGEDIPAGVVVFLVALPLCLGIAVASGAPPFAGIVAGVVGGLVVSIASGSQLSVSGPAAGLTVIVAAAMESLGFRGLLVAIALAGVMQIAMGFARAGVIGAYFPSAVIKGMLAAIGIILIMKQVPHAVGFDADAEDDLSALQENSHWALRMIFDALSSMTPGAAVISLVCVAILLTFERPAIKTHRWLRLVPGPLVAVLFGIGFGVFAAHFAPALALEPEHFVRLPVLSGAADLVGQLSFPDFSLLTKPGVWTTAATLALVASLETLLSLEAVDKLDPMKRTAPTNRELKAQGLGNLISGLIGGLPVTAVIVRSSANIDAGGRTKASCFSHGVLLLFSALFLASFINLVPLSALAAVLLLTGYKLAKPKLFFESWEKGFDQFAPFIVTVLAILATDLLKGMAIGMAVGLAFVLYANWESAISLTRDGNHYLLRFKKDVSFLNKAPLRAYLESVEEGGYLIVDGARAGFIDRDILETLEDFIKAAPEDGIHVELRNIRGLVRRAPLTDQPLVAAPSNTI